MKTYSIAGRKFWMPTPGLAPSIEVMPDGYLLLRFFSQSRGSVFLYIKEGQLSELEKGSIRCSLRYSQLGTRTTVRILPPKEGEVVSLTHLTWSGRIKKSGPTLLFLCDAGGWSGGRNLFGFAALQEGSRVELERKGYYEWLCFHEGTVKRTDIAPFDLEGA